MDLFDIVAARQGGTGGGTPQKQADWNENNSSKKSFIKNRTHWKEEVEVDYLTLHYTEPIPGLGLAPYGRKIGLELNQTYNIEVDLEGQIYTLPATTSEMPKDLLGVVVPGVVYLHQRDLGLVLLDGIEGDFETSTITGTDNCYYTFNSGIPNIKIHGVKGTDTIYHKIPKEYLPEVTIPKDFINTEMLKDNIVTTDKVLDGSITRQKIEQPVLLYDSILSEELTFINYINLEGSRFRIIMNRLFVNLESQKEYNDDVEVIVNGLSVNLPLVFTPSNISAELNFVFDIDMSTDGVVEVSVVYQEVGASSECGFAKSCLVNQSLQTKHSITLGASPEFRAGTEVKLYKMLS